LFVKKDDLRGLPLHASQISYFDCERKLALYILCKVKAIKIPLYENKHLLAGNVLHAILQDTFRWFNFPLVEHFYYNKKNSVEDSLKKAFFYQYDKWKNLFDLQIPSSLWMNDPSSIDDVHNKVINQIDNLAKLASTLVKETDDMIESQVLGEEFHLSYNLKNALLIGNIDILARTNKPKLFRLIELKTGNRYSSDEIQLKIYGEVFRKSFPEYELKLELWHPNYVKKIKKEFKLSQNDEVLPKIENLVERVMKISKIKDLPPEKDNSYYCNKICKFCKDYIPEIFNIDSFSDY